MIIEQFQFQYVFTQGQTLASYNEGSTLINNVTTKTEVIHTIVEQVKIKVGSA